MLEGNLTPETPELCVQQVAPQPEPQKPEPQPILPDGIGFTLEHEKDANDVMEQMSAA